MKRVLFFLVLFLCVSFVFATEINFNGQIFDLNKEGSVDADYLMGNYMFVNEESFCVAEARGGHGASFNCVLFKDEIVFLGSRSLLLGDFDLSEGFVFLDGMESDIFSFESVYLNSDYDVDVFYVDPKLNFIIADFYFGNVGIKIESESDLEVEPIPNPEDFLNEELIVINNLDDIGSEVEKDLVGVNGLGDVEKDSCLNFWEYGVNFWKKLWERRSP